MRRLEEWTGKTILSLTQMWDLWKILNFACPVKSVSIFNRGSSSSLRPVGFRLVESTARRGLRSGRSSIQLKLTSNYRWRCWHDTIYSVAIQLSTASDSICHGSGWEFCLILRPCPAKSINHLSGVKKSDKLFISLWSLPVPPAP